MMVVSVEIRRKQHKPGLLDRIQRSLSGPKQVKVGLPNGEADGDIIKIGIYNHFGTKGSGKGFVRNGVWGFGGPIPERPFLSNAMRDNRNKYRDGMQTAARAILAGEYDMRTALNRLGIMAQGDIQREIQSLSTPPNSPVTVAIKGSSNPLVDTGRLGQSITWALDE